MPSHSEGIDVIGFAHVFEKDLSDIQDSLMENVK
jgi:hypothetical protein